MAAQPRRDGAARLLPLKPNPNPNPDPNPNPNPNPSPNSNPNPNPNRKPNQARLAFAQEIMEGNLALAQPQPAAEGEFAAY